MLKRAEPRTIGTPGTELGIAIRTATDSFKRAGQGTRVLLLVTDGEDHGEGTIEAAKYAAAAGVIVYAIGIGSPERALLRAARGAVP